MHVYGSANSTTFDSNLRAYYDMNEGSGSAVYNRTATSGLNLTTTASPTFSDVKTSNKANGKTVVTFPRSYLTPGGGWTVDVSANRADALAIGGGGGGASRHAGGGGAGEVGFYNALTLTQNSVLRIKIGAGGLGLSLIHI